MMTLDPKHIRRDDRAKTKGSLFGIVDEMAADAFPIGAYAAEKVSWKREDSESGLTLRLI